MGDPGNGCFPTSRNAILTGDAPAISVRGSNYYNANHNNWPLRNFNDLVLEGMDVPEDYYIKLCRLQTPDGPMVLSARIVVEYECTVTLLPNAGPWLHSTVSGNPGNYGTVDYKPPDHGNLYLFNDTPMGPLWKFHMWGVPYRLHCYTNPFEALYQPSVTFTSLTARGNRRQQLPAVS